MLLLRKQVATFGEQLTKVGGILVFLQEVNPQRWWGKNLQRGGGELHEPTK